MKTHALIIALTATATTTAAAAAWAAEPIATLRGPTALVEQGAAPAMAKVSDEDLRRARNYPEQPPTIPHHIRRATADSNAPMVSITHFMNRDGQFLASVSPRRYFCTQCHVTQQALRPLVGNDFVDIDSVLAIQGQD